MRSESRLLFVVIAALGLSSGDAQAQQADILLQTIDACLAARADAHTAANDLAALGWVENEPAALNEAAAKLLSAQSEFERVESISPDANDWKAAWDRVQNNAAGLKRLKNVNDAREQTRFMIREADGSILKLRTQNLEKVRITTCHLVATPDTMPAFLKQIAEMTGGPLTSLPPVKSIPLRPKSDAANERSMFFLLLDPEEIAQLVNEPFSATASVNTYWQSPPAP